LIEFGGLWTAGLHQTYQGQSSRQTATTRKTKKQILLRRLPFTFLGEETHTHIPRMELPLYKGHPKKKRSSEAISGEWQPTPLGKIANIPLQKGPFSRGTVEGQAVSFLGSSVSMCNKVFVWSFFQERCC